MKDIFDITYNADGSTTVYYTDGTSSTSLPGATGPTTGYGSGQNGNGSSYTTGTSKKWWEVALGVFPAIVAGIFGNSTTNYQGQYPQNPYPTGNYQQNGMLGGGNNSNMIIIILVAVVVLFLLLGNKK